MITGVNGKIATTPFKTKSLQVEVKGGYGVISNRSSLTELTVLIGNKEKGIEVGDIVYVAGESFQNQTWAKNELDLEGQTCIVFGTEWVLFVKKAEKGPWTDTLGIAQ